MGNCYDVKITVLKRFDPAEVFEKSPVASEQPIKACDLFTRFIRSTFLSLRLCISASERVFARLLAH